jgi:microsomal dipeptidase-like Zn-dependent dipeptidase
MAQIKHGVLAIGACAALAGGGCGKESRLPAPEHDGVYGFADACVVIELASPGGRGARFVAVSDDGAAFEAHAESEESAARFTMKPSDLGTYLLRDHDAQYLRSDGEVFARAAELESDVTMVQDGYLSGAEWELAISASDPERFQLTHLATGLYVGVEGLVADAGEAAEVTLFSADGCAPYPELTTDADGIVERFEHDDGSVYGIVDTHSHILTNFAFGGGGVYHGAPFHPLGVEHALPDCLANHGSEGRRDLLGYGFDHVGRTDADETLFLSLVTGRAPEFNHFTDGYPTFTGWPNAHFSSTHQTQYYKWLERAYLGGLRLVIQHATSNQILCELMVGIGAQPARYSCSDMVAADRILEETFAMERYIDAQEGGPGQGWFRIVTSPEQAREVIRDGKMAVVLGIEVSNLFDCFLVPPAGAPQCDEAHIRAELDRYHDLGVRALFPVHKYDNAMSAGDGDRGITELGNFVQTGHYLNFTEDCPQVQTAFDRGNVTFGDLNQPRDDYDGEPPFDMSSFAESPIDVLLEFADELRGGPLEGEFCQNAGLTPLGEYLIEEIIARGMILEIDHLPPRAYLRAFEILEELDYPAAGTHGVNNEGALYALGGVSKTDLGRCRDNEDPGAMAARLRERVDLIESQGGFPAEGFGFDFNGFAGAPGPRLGPDSVCDEPQDDPLTYPFESFAGDVTFLEPRVGERVIDFNTEGMAHIGLLPELIEDARRGGVSDEDLEPLFKSAEGYIRMWERAEDRAGALGL